MSFAIFVVSIVSAASSVKVSFQSGSGNILSNWKFEKNEVLKFPTYAVASRRENIWIKDRPELFSAFGFFLLLPSKKQQIWRSKKSILFPVRFYQKLFGEDTFQEHQSPKIFVWCSYSYLHMWSDHKTKQKVLRLDTRFLQAIESQ